MSDAPRDGASSAPADDILLVGGEHHLTRVVLACDPRAGLPPTVRPIALPDQALMGLVLPVVHRPGGDDPRYAFAFANNCYARTTYRLEGGTALYTWIGADGIPDPTPSHLRAAGLIRLESGALVNESALHRADLQ